MRYKVAQTEGGSPIELDTLLNKYGKDGWILFQMFQKETIVNLADKTKATGYCYTAIFHSQT